MGIALKHIYKKEIWPQCHEKWVDGEIKPIKDGYYLVFVSESEYGYYFTDSNFYDGHWGIQEGNNPDPYNFFHIHILYYISVPYPKEIE